MNITNIAVKKPTYEEFISKIENSTHHHSSNKVLTEMRGRIAECERKYGMASAEFVTRYKRGDFEMDNTYNDGDLFLWNSALNIINRLQKD